MLYETEFVNRRSSTVEVLEGGRVLLTLQPGERKFVESRDPGTSYAAWRKVVYTKGGVDVQENRDWRFPLPEGWLRLTIVNVDGAPSETFYVGAMEPVQCYRGIPRFVAVDYHDSNWALIERVELRLVEHREREGDYVVTRRRLERIITPRSKREVREIQRRLLAEATEKARRDLERRFPMQGA